MSEETTGTSAEVYKLLRESEHEVLERFGRFAGSPDDERDGFVHLSSADQVAGTAAKYFAGENVVLVALSVESMGDALRYEESRGGALFPHLYGAMMRAMVLSATPVEWVEEQHAFASKFTAATPEPE
ncbi:MAG: hypothetical protein ACI9KE_001541 [Polyangiales bacterium]|jgi:uncharacterized protein (DUF952 family)